MAEELHDLELQRSDSAYRRGVAKAYGECAGELDLLKHFGGAK